MLTTQQGFDAKVFSISTRLQGEDSKPIYVKYKISGSEQKYIDFYGIATVYNRNRTAFKQILGKTLLP